MTMNSTVRTGQINELSTSRICLTQDGGNLFRVRPYDDFTVATSASSSSPSSSSSLPLPLSPRSPCRESLIERDPVSEALESESEGEEDESDSLSRSFSSGMKITLKREDAKHKKM